MDKEVAIKVMAGLSKETHATIECCSEEAYGLCLQFLDSCGRKTRLGCSYLDKGWWKIQAGRLLFFYNEGRYIASDEEEYDDYMQDSKDDDVYYNWSVIEAMLDEAGGYVDEEMSVTDDELDLFLFG